MLHALAIPWVIVCDGAAFDVEKRQARHPHIFDQVLKTGIDAPALAQFLHRLDTGKRKRIMNRRMFTDERKLSERYGIFTLAPGWTTSSRTSKTPGDKSFESFIESTAPGNSTKPKTKQATAKSERGAGWVPPSPAQPKWLTCTTGCSQPWDAGDLPTKQYRQRGQCPTLSRRFRST